MRILATLVAGALALCSCSRANVPARSIVRLSPVCARAGAQLTIVGDSLARGWGASSAKTTFASLIYTSLRRKFTKTTFHNLGTPGATTDEIAMSEVRRIYVGNCSLIVVLAGGNDVQRLYTPSHFRASYRELLAAIRRRLPSGAIVVIGLPDVSQSPRIPWFLKPMESRLSRDADESIEAAAREYGAAFVPLYDLSHSEAYRWKALLSNDEIHPNDEGYRIMAGAALPAIMTVLQAQR